MNLLICVCLLLAPTTSPSSTQPSDYYSLSPDEFANLKELDRTVDYLRFDRKLLSAAIVFETNRYRVEQRLSPLAHLDKLDDAEMLHVRDMVAKKYLAHEETGTKYPHPWDRVTAVGLHPQYVGENIALIFGIQYTGGKNVYPLDQWHREGLSYKENGPAIPPQTYRTFARDAVKQWIDSPGHRAQIMRPETRYMGFACEEAMPTGNRVGDDFHKFFGGQVFYTPREVSSEPPMNADERG